MDGPKEREGWLIQLAQVSTLKQGVNPCDAGFYEDTDWVQKGHKAFSRNAQFPMRHPTRECGLASRLIGCQSSAQCTGHRRTWCLLRISGCIPTSHVTSHLPSLVTLMDTAINFRRTFWSNLLITSQVTRESCNTISSTLVMPHYLLK